MGQLAQQGETIYQEHILPKLDTATLKGKIVAIDVDSKDYFIENRTPSSNNVQCSNKQ